MKAMCTDQKSIVQSVQLLALRQLVGGTDLHMSMMRMSTGPHVQLKLTFREFY